MIDLYWYRSDPIFKNIFLDTDQCHRQIKKYPGLHGYFIDAMNVTNFRNMLDNGPAIAITNSILKNYEFLNLVEPVSNSFYGIYYTNYQPEECVVVKDFNCFINRMDPIRQSWLYQLFRRGLFDRGYVSFNMDISRHPNPNNISRADMFEKQYQEQLTIFKAEHLQAQKIVPYKNFTDNGNLTNTIMSSKFSVILETYFNNNNIVTYSEKIFRALQLPRPWILFGPRLAVTHLRSMGFDVYDDIVNHDRYDLIEFEIDRQVVILDMMEELCNLNIIKLNARLIQGQIHNQNLLKQFNNTWKEDFLITLSNAQQRLNNAN